MSHIQNQKQNQKWIEAAFENFHEALDSDNITLAKEIIADTQEAGFSEDARCMNTLLREATRYEEKSV